MSTADKPRKRILVVDDEPDATTFLARLLEGSGYEAHIVNHPLQVVKTALEVHPDLILLDIQMPHLLGTDVALLLKKHPALRHIPFIYLSGMTDEDHRAIAGMTEAAAFLEKPVDSDELFEALRTVLGRNSEGTP